MRLLCSLSQEGWVGRTPSRTCFRDGLSAGERGEARCEPQFRGGGLQRRWWSAAWEATLIKHILLFSVVSIEDPFDQDDWEAWQKFTASAGIQVVGDDLTVTNPKRIAKAVSEKSCNCLLLKVNQIGSVTESLQA